MTRAAVIRQLFGTPAIVVLLLAPGAAYAQDYVSPLIGYDFGGDSGCPAITACEGRKLNVGVSAGSLGDVFGSELEFAYARDFFGDMSGASSSVLTLMGNVMVTPQFGVAQPYALIGVGLIKTRVEFSVPGGLESNNNHFGGDVGGGVMILLGRHLGVRGDLRYFHSFQHLEVLGIGLGNIQLDFGRAAAGLVFRF